MRPYSRSLLRMALCLVAVLLAVPVLAGAPQSPKDNTPAAGKGRCEVGQVHKWSGHGWVCAEDLVGNGPGTGSGPRIADASGDIVGPVLGTALVGGTTVPTVLFSLSDDPKPFLLAVDEGGFLSGGRLLVQTEDEVRMCASLHGMDVPALNSCLSPLPACDASNAWLEAPAPASSLFRVGAVVDATAATAELWAATSASATPIGECFGSVIPACATVVYHPADDTCTVEIQLGGEIRNHAYPAVPVVDLHVLHVPPYALRPQ